MPLPVEINVALREQNCQKIGSERVKQNFKKFHLLLSLWFCMLEMCFVCFIDVLQHSHVVAHRCKGGWKFDLLSGTLAIDK